MITPAEFVRNVRRSIGMALGAATVISGYVACLSWLRPPAMASSQHFSVAQLVAGYFLAATAAGLVVGCLWPLTRSRVGAAFVGCVAGTIVYAAVAVATGEGIDGVRLAPIPGVLVGGGLGLHFWSQSHPERRSDTRRRTIVLMGVLIVLVLVVALRLLLSRAVA